MLAVEQANADIRAITEANAGSESEIAVLKNESEHSRFRIDDATSELERAGQGRESIEREAADHRAAIETLKSGMAGPAPGRYRRRYCPPAGHRHRRQGQRRVGAVGRGGCGQPPGRGTAPGRGAESRRRRHRRGTPPRRAPL